MAVEQGQYKYAVGVFSNQQDIDSAFNQLQNSGFPMSQVSMIPAEANPGQISESQVSRPPANSTIRGVITGVATGGALGALVGVLLGLGLVPLPGVGQLVEAGSTSTTFTTTSMIAFWGAAIGGFIGAFMGSIVEKKQVNTYDHQLPQGQYLLKISGTDNQLDQAESILSAQGVQDWSIHNSAQQSSK